MDEFCSVADFRSSLEVARQLAKARIPFVVMPVFEHDEFNRLAMQAAKKLEELERKVEEARA